jgi:carbamoyltransferase
VGPHTIGLNFGTHDAAAAIVIDGAVVAAAEEERFTRAKQTKVFPTHAIEYCLSEAGIQIADVDDVAFFVDPLLQLGLPIANWYHGFPASAGSMLSDLAKYRQRRQEFASIRGAGRLAKTTTVTPVRHHLAHAASAYLTSPFDDSLVVTIDGRGEYETAAIFEGRGGRLRQKHSVKYPHSIGYLYSMATRYLGFRPQRDEYKVMGLAGYGGDTYHEKVAKLATFDDRTGRLRLNLDYFDHHRRTSADRNLFSSKLIALLGPPRLPNGRMSDRYREIAGAVQHLTEDLVSRYVLFAQRLLPSRSLCLAGGVALNGVANAKLIESGHFDSMYVQPAANDAGASIGAALAVASQRIAAPVRRPMTNAFLGPAFDDAKIEKALLVANLAGYHISIVPDRYKAAAGLLARHLIIGWFQGRMEFGPRALGARSILANPSRASNTARVNALIKRREMFRPLAPAVMAEHATEYFALHDAGRHVYPFMLATAQVLAAKRDRIPAVVHVDGSARVQTVSVHDNPMMWNLIEQFRRLTGLPLVLNTSFNGADEPIVCTPEDAVRTFLACGLDALLIGDYLAIRREQKE